MSLIFIICTSTTVSCVINIYSVVCTSNYKVQKDKLFLARKLPQDTWTPRLSLLCNQLSMKLFQILMFLWLIFHCNICNNNLNIFNYSTKADIFCSTRILEQDFGDPRSLPAKYARSTQPPHHHQHATATAAAVFYLAKSRQDQCFASLTSCGSPGPYETFFSIIKSSALNESSEIEKLTKMPNFRIELSLEKSI